MPGTRRKAPSRPSSARNERPSTAGASSWPSAARTPTAIARSSPEPPLRRPDGARLTVIRFRGHPRPLDMTALRTLSRDSRQAASGNPTMAKPGSPLDTWTSTLTARPSTPRSVAAGTVASTVTSPVCAMRTPQLHLRMKGKATRGQWDHTRGVGHSPGRELPEHPPLCVGQFGQSRPMALKTSRAAPTGSPWSSRTVSARARWSPARDSQARRPRHAEACWCSSLTACMSTEESSVFNRINDVRAKSWPACAAPRQRAGRQGTGPQPADGDPRQAFPQHPA